MKKNRIKGNEFPNKSHPLLLVSGKGKFFCALLFLLLVLAINQVSAQTGSTITGIVTDEKGDTLPGVHIQIKGTSEGTITDASGKYKIRVLDFGGTLVFTYIGFSAQEISINNRTTINVVLQSEISNLDEVVVIAYQKVRKADLTGSVTMVSKKETQDRILTSLSDLMKGRAAGVQITENDGMPGSTSLIQIRGASSVYAENEPLYVIDGIVGSGKDVNVADIENVGILKDASATAIYGSRGANGVILITTKTGIKGKPRISFYANQGLQYIPKFVDVMDSEEYMRAYSGKNSIKYYKKGSYVPPSSTLVSYYDSEQNVYLWPSDWGSWTNYSNPDSINTDWQDVMYQKAIVKDYRFSVSGGSEDQSYFLSLNYLGQDGIIVNSGADKFSGRFNFNQNLNKNMSLKLNLSATVSSRFGDISGDANSIVMKILQQQPIKAVDDTEDDNLDAETLGENSNPYYNAMNQTVKDGESRYFSSFTFDWKIGRLFRFQSQNTYTQRNSSDERYYPSNTGRGLAANGLAQLKSGKSYGLITENLLFFHKSFSTDHKVDGLLGLSFDFSQDKGLTAENRNFDIEALGVYGIQLGVNPVIPITTLSETTLLSAFGRINYSLFDRYLFTTTIRQDGSSKFGNNNKYALFPSAAFAWRLDQEEFLKNMNVFSNLKFRISWGKSGNQGIPAYRSFSTLTSAITTIDGVNQVFGIAPDRVSNPSLKWETTSQTDIGLEVGILKSKVNLTIDVYKKITSDLLNNLSCPLYTGYTNFWTNLGKIENKGLEIAIDANIIQNKNFYWSLAYNMSFNRGKVLEINENGYLLRNVYYSAGNWNLAKEGEPLGLWYGFNRTDIYQSQSEIDNSGITRIYTFPISQIEPGWKKIQDMNDDGIINDDDKVILGNGNPKFTGGFINNFTYKSFDLSVAFQFSYGADIFNATKVKLLRVRGSQNISKELNNNWLPDLYAINTDGTMGDLVIKGNPSNTYPRTGFHEDNNMYNDNIEDGSFLRLSDVTLGYSLPIKISKIAKINHIRFFLSGKNLWLLTKYTGYDPEVNTSNSSLFAPGMDLGAYPKARVFSIGVNVDF